jgi:hypothetical protein
MGERQHGTRAKYVGDKCRCDLCRKANRDYYHLRQSLAKAEAQRIDVPVLPSPQEWTAPDGTKRVRMYKRACPGVDGQPCTLRAHLRKDSKGGVCRECRKKLIWNGLVPADKAREHLLWLSSQNVGRRAVSAATDVAESIIQGLMKGERKNLRAQAEKKILAVDTKSVSDHALVPGKETWRMIKELLSKYGYTKGEIALDLGSKTPALQLKKRFVLAETEYRVRKMFEEAVSTITSYEKSSDDFERRRAAIRRMLPCETAELKDGLTEFYEGEAGERKLYRDLHDLGAVRDGFGAWKLVRE